MQFLQCLMTVERERGGGSYLKKERERNFKDKYSKLEKCVKRVEIWKTPLLRNLSTGASLTFPTEENAFELTEGG